MCYKKTIARVSVELETNIMGEVAEPTTLVHQLQLVSPLDAYSVKTKTCQYEFLELSCAPEQLKSVVSRIIRTARLHLEVKECKLLYSEGYEFINNTH
jgi:hypothetical protein